MTSPDTPSSGTFAVGANGKHNCVSEKDAGDDDIAPPHVAESPTQMTEDTVVDDEGHVHQDGKQRANSTERAGSNSSEEDEEEDEEDEEEEDDEEPSLKYQRITGAVPDLLRKDSASALAVSNKLLVYFNNTCMIYQLYLFFFSTGNGHPRRDHTHSRPDGETHKIL